MGFERSAATVNGKPVTWRRGGAGANILYLHQASGFRISRPLERLAEKFTVWIPIIPGFDGTEFAADIQTPPQLADLLASFIDQVIRTEEPCDVVGHSLGSWLGAWLAIRHPAKVDHLVLGAPAGFRSAGAPPLSFEPSIMLKQLYAHPENRPPEDKTPEMIAANRAAVAHYKLGNSHDPQLIAKAREIASEVLILHGTKDQRVPVEAVRRLRHDIKNSQLLYIYDAAHSLEVDQPERVGQVIVDFLLRGEAFIVNPGIAQDASGARIAAAPQTA